jgi:hypothetical protein
VFAEPGAAPAHPEPSFEFKASPVSLRLRRSCGDGFRSWRAGIIEGNHREGRFP